MLEKTIYDTHGGANVMMYTLGDGLLSVDIIDRGARINAIRVNGVDVALGFDSVSDYAASKTYAGATVGRVANRIAKGRFSLGGRQYVLAVNNGENHLHGGEHGFDDKPFELIEKDDESITLAYTSIDGEEGYPGTLTLRVKFTVKDGALGIAFSAASDADTLWSPTNHTYFNLDGDAETCLDNVLTINADRYTPTDGGLIPTGEILTVDGTPFDFRKPTEIGARFGAAELKATDGYDHNYVLGRGGCAAVAYGKKTGVEMTLFTDLPCMQLYTGGSLGGCKGKHDARYGKWAGFCLEPQYAPDAVNHDEFQKPLLEKGKIKKHCIEYKFLCK